MGTDKALTVLAGRPLVAYAVEVLKQAGLKASIVGARAELAAFGSVIKDAGVGPLGGICAGLASTDCELSVFLPVDLPLLPSSLIAVLLDHARTTGAAVTVPSVNGFAQTFPAVLDRELLAPLRAALENGKGGCFEGFKSAAAETGKPMRVLPMEMLVQAGQVGQPDGLPAATWFLNVNRPDDLARAESLIVPANRVS
jgi:molybdopterin-guanine dinucleotide biosynthesis protein A